MIFIFKTNVGREDLEFLIPMLELLLNDSNWNFDMEDIDRILRIEGHLETAESAVNLLEANGFYCEELSD